MRTGRLVVGLVIVLALVAGSIIVLALRRADVDAGSPTSPAVGSLASPAPPAQTPAASSSSSSSSSSPQPTRPPPAPRSTSTPVLLPDPPPPEEPTLDAVVEQIPDDQWDRIVRTGTWRPGCPVGREDLRRITLTHITFDGTVERGVLVVNRDVVDDVIDVFGGLLDARFPIAEMRPVERYDGEVNTSLAANNTSAFNCRKPGQINAPEKESPHANGRAIDINPVQNPWRDPRCSCWSPTAEHATATDGPGIIREGSLPVELFEAKGWIWQDIKVPDYMHFDTGYPSRPWRT